MSVKQPRSNVSNQHTIIAIIEIEHGSMRVRNYISLFNAL